MAPIPADLKKGDTPMTDLQFTAYMDIRDKYDALLQEIVALRLAPQGKTAGPQGGAAEPFGEYQFKKYEEVRDECEHLRTELTALHKENTRLKMQVELLKSDCNVNRQ